MSHSNENLLEQAKQAQAQALSADSEEVSEDQCQEVSGGAYYRFQGPVIALDESPTKTSFGDSYLINGAIEPIFFK